MIEKPPAQSNDGEVDGTWDFFQVWIVSLRHLGRFVGSSLHGRREGVLYFLIYDECLLKRHQPDVIFWPQRLRISGPGGKLILGLLIG